MAILGFPIFVESGVVAATPVGFPQAWYGAAGEVRLTMPEAGWADGMGIWAGKNSNLDANSVFRLALWDASTGVPGSLIDFTPEMAALSQGRSNLQATLLNKGLLVAGRPLALGFVVNRNGALAFSYNTTISATFVQAFRNGGGAVNPTHPFEAGSTITETPGIQPAAIFLNYTPNSAPNAPINIAVQGVTTPGPILSTVTPTFTFTFSDPDKTAGRAEKVQRYEFRLKNADTGETIWPPSGSPTAAQFTATTAEQAAASITRAYPGATATSPALVSGGDYTVEIRTQDLAGAWGAYSAPFAFSIADIGAVSVADGTPSGKIDTVTSAISYTARWNHPDGTATSHVQVEVLQGGATWRLGAEVAKIVASAALPGAAFTITAADAGIGELPRGEDFTYRVRARASGIWTDWSAQRAFTTNAPPTMPVPVSPADGEVVTSPPLLSWLSSDPDADDIMGADVVWTLRLTRPSPLSVLTFQHPADAMSFDGELSLASFQLTATHVPNTGTYVWEVLADDLSASAVQADYGKSAWSDPAQFSLATGPQPTLDLPAATVNTVSPLYRWTVVNGPSVAYRVVVYLAGTTTRVWDSQRVDSTSLDVVQPAGFLRNGTSYDVQVTVWTAAEQQGTSMRRRFAVTFTAPAAISGLTATEYRAQRDPEPTTIALSWNQTVLPAGEFQGYIVRRRFEGETPDAAIILAGITNPAQSRWWDFHAPPGVGLIYSVSQLRRSGSGPGNPIVEGPQTDVSTRLDLGVIVIATTRNPGVERVVITYEPVDIGDTPRQNTQPYVAWGSENIPTMISTPGTQDVFRITGTLETDGNVTQQQLYASLKSIIRAQAIVSFRYERERIFGKLFNPSLNPGTEFDPDTVSFEVQQTNFQEGL